MAQSDNRSFAAAAYSSRESMTDRKRKRDSDSPDLSGEDPKPMSKYSKAILTFLNLQGKTNVKDDVATPAEMYKDMHKLFQFTHDPCPLNGADKEGQDAGGLTEEWGSVNYVNPPFSNIPPWILKAIHEAKKGRKTVMLVPARFNTKYWRLTVQPNVNTVVVFTQRFAFQGYSGGAPMSICLLFFGFTSRDLDVIPRDWQPGGVHTWRLQSWIY